MEPETEKLIAEYPELSVEEAKLLFIRKSGQEAYCEDKIAEGTKSILKEIIELSTVASMSKDEIAQHIGNLEKARSFLAAFTQGLSKAHADEVEPKIKAKRAREKAAKAVSKSKKPKADAMFAALMAAEEDIEVMTNLDKDPSNAGKKIVSKIKCPKCQKEVFTLKFHKC